jgi:CRP/FNR family cyclic AMP-dependent transcriptional regulator
MDPNAARNFIGLSSSMAPRKTKGDRDLCNSGFDETLFVQDHFGKKMLPIEAARKIVTGNGWLSLTPPLFQAEVLDRCWLQTFKAGQNIFMAGDPPGGMFGLVSGGLAISIAPGERGPYFAHLARPGTWFGESSAITQQPRRIGLAATRDSQLLHLPLAKISEIVARDPAAWRLFALVTSGHIDMAIGACDDLMIRDHVKRFVAILLRLGGCRYSSPRETSLAEIDLRQEELATLANVARTTAGSILRRLETMGHIQQSYRRIRILAPDTLRAMLCD